MHTNLPIRTILQPLKDTLETYGTIILSAPPGSGKTTIIPIYLMNFFTRKILVLEPRRIAAKNSAERASYLIQETVGNKVGYRTRFESKISPQAKVEFITEGIFLKKIQNDPEIQDVDLVIFDEFHERSLNSDLSLALLIESRKLFRPSLKIIIMSATISPGEIQKKIPNSKVLVAEGSLFPVAIEYAKKISPLRQQLREIICNRNLPRGNILIFLPGSGEINSAIEESREYLSEEDRAMPLYSDLDSKLQNQIFEDIGKRKIIFSTNIAETSLTLDDISVVIDSGYQKRSYYNSDSGMNSLKTERISLDSAEQRKGRAGRVKTGVCFRLWTKEEEKEFLKYTPPQIKYMDLSEVILHTKKFGVDVNSLLWIDPPNQSHLKKAEELLIGLGALETNGDINGLGKKIIEVPLPGRLSIMILKTQKMNSGLKALELSVILSERLYSFKTESQDMSIIYEEIKYNKNNLYYKRFTRGISRLVSYFPDLDDENTLSIGGVLALAFPDRIARKRETNSDTYKFLGGKGGYIQVSNASKRYEYIVVPELDSRSGNSKIFLYSEISKEEIYKLFYDKIADKIILSNYGGDRFKVVRYKMFGEIILEEKEELNPDSNLIEDAILAYLAETECKDLNWDLEVHNFLNRINLVHTFNSSFPKVLLEEMKKNPKPWLGYFLAGIKRISELKSLDLLKIFKSRLTYKEMEELDVQAPEYFNAPSGRKIRIDYSTGDLVIQIKLQELFGLIRTPVFVYGQVVPTFHLLSPAGRPIQVTRDLESFWLKTYKDVRKELRGRYPKHPWPEDPLTAIPTHKTKKKID